MLLWIYIYMCERQFLFQPKLKYGGIDQGNSISVCVRERIISKLIEPNYYDDVRCTLSARRWWRIIGHVFETTSKVAIAGSGILSFSSGFYGDKRLALFAGVTSTLSLALAQLGLYCFKQSKNNTDELNTILQKIKIETVPNLNGGSCGSPTAPDLRL